ncbi:UNVERIFIED_CONTAM: putative inactive receptor kinase [Sesamum angustifolium]|uniref:Inactive receptor kinase n=1 Tax=Sesamum angustifolium TaxID=2727405 RepID=A0AAW2LGF7_9LAMI
MSAVYDNWERLVAAVIRKQQLWELFHDHSRSPSILSEASNSSSIFNLSSHLNDLGLNFSNGSFAKSRRAPAKLVLISDFSPAIDIKEAGIVSPKLLGTGTFGSAYTATMANWVRIVVKKLNKSLSISELDFKRHMDVAGNVRHENVVAVRAYFSSEDERLVLYDYYSKGSVYALLHGKTGGNPAHVDWETRLKIAIGAARGIAAIHAQNGGKLVHGNIKASNVFLNSEKYGCVSDLGLTNMIETTFVPTAWCYAPEVKNTRDMSQASDVYSFGILLLELLTRKSTSHVPGGPEAVDLVKLVNSVKSKARAAKVFDDDLMENPAVREQMVKMLQIGIRCVAKSINKRPKISEVVTMLEDLMTNTGNSGSSERKLLFFEDSNATFDLEDMLRASAEFLGKGTFGTSYKALFEYGNAIVVKRSKDVDVTFMVFQQHIEVIGRMRHDNVAELKAYFFSRDEVLLVYDYYRQGSLSAMLHGTGNTPLDWTTRLRIAVGAARGIAHIHQQDGGKLVHGNINSSNIFLNEQEYGLVSDVGLAKVMNLVGRSALRTQGYCAPEVRDTTEVSQASDVYSFGVVLLELVSRKPSQWTKNGRIGSLVDSIQYVSHREWTTVEVDFELLRYRDEEETILQTVRIAMDCVATVPESRPRMPEVVKILEEISGIEPFNDVWEDTWGGQSIESRLEDLLDDLLPTLTL